MAKTLIKERFSATVSVPVVNAVATLSEMDNHAQESWFIKYRDRASSLEQKTCFDMCRALIKWASSCDGHIDSISNSKNGTDCRLVFTFAFANFASLNSFIKDLEVSVYGATMGN